MEARIAGIIPGDGWYAEHAMLGHSTLMYSPVVCFALLDVSDGMQAIVPMEYTPQGVRFCDEIDTFVGVRRGEFLTEDIIEKPLDENDIMHSCDGIGH